MIYEVSSAQLEGRKAKCVYGNHAPLDSSLELAFFEYTGPGSRESENICTCGYHKVAHDKHFRCTNFVPKGPSEFDRYYCGCEGWD